MSRFNIGNLVYTYDEQGLIYKNQVLGVVGGFYMLTGRPEPVNTQYVFRTKKECLQAMKDAGIEKKSLQMATVIKLENKIADLEAKLAESEEKCNKQWLEIQAETHQIQMLEQDIKRIKKELKQQLAEKDKEIEVLKLDYDFVAKQYKELMRMGNFIIEQKDQDKISFCVEQLEKVKDHNENIFCDDKVYYTYITQFIDQQIKQLKEEK